VSGLKLFVKIDDSYHEVSSLLAGENLKPLIKISIESAVEKYLVDFTSQKCIKNQNNEKLSFSRMIKHVKSREKYFVSELSLDDFESLENVYIKTMKYSSCVRRFSTYSHFLKKCVDWEYIYENPLEKIKKRKIEKNHFKAWTREEYLKVLSMSSGVFKDLLQFAWLTGCRPMEAKNLKWTDIDFDKKVLILKCGKNADISRVFPMNDDICNFFHSLEMRGNIVFNNKGREISNDNFYQYISHRLKKLNINHLAPYGLRHSFASRLSNAGVNAFHIQFLLGHRDIRTTTNYVQCEKNELILSLNKIA